MAEVLFWANLCASGIITLLWFRRRAGYLELPFLFGAMFLIWYLPQVWVLVDAPQINQPSLARLLSMSFICVLALTFGWLQGVGKDQTSIRALEMPTERMILPVVGITLFAAAMEVLISTRPVEELTASQWTGPITILSFFRSVGVVSLVASLAMILKERSIYTVGIAACNLMLYLPRVLVYFRRADIFELALAMMLALYFVRGRTVPRLGLAAAAIAGFFLVHGVGELRSLGGGYQLTENRELATRIPSLQDIAGIDWVASLKFRDPSARSEVRNALEFIEVAERTGSLTMGAQFWNMLIHAYVPGQILGTEFKRSLLIGASLQEAALDETFYVGVTGATATGFPPVYQDFWMLGAFVFAISGFITGVLFRRARYGQLTGYLMYGSIVTLGVHTLTHTGYYLLAYSLLPIAGCLFVAIFTRSKASPSKGNDRPAGVARAEHR
jgi:hypothetical protein